MSILVGLFVLLLLRRISTLWPTSTDHNSNLRSNVAGKVILGIMFSLVGVGLQHAVDIEVNILEYARRLDQARAAWTEYAHTLASTASRLDRLDLPACGEQGNSHLPMMDHNSTAVVRQISAWLATHAG